jgi:hypothetical protein
MDTPQIATPHQDTPPSQAAATAPQEPQLPDANQHIRQAVELRFRNKSEAKRAEYVTEVSTYLNSLTCAGQSVATLFTTMDDDARDDFLLLERCCDEYLILPNRSYLLGAYFHILTLMVHVADTITNISGAYRPRGLSRNAVCKVIMHAWVLERIQSAQPTPSKRRIDISRRVTFSTTEADVKVIQKITGNRNAPVFPYYCGKTWALDLVKSTRELWLLFDNDSDNEGDNGNAGDVNGDCGENTCFFYSFDDNGIHDDPAYFVPGLRDDDSEIDTVDSPKLIVQKLPSTAQSSSSTTPYAESRSLVESLLDTLFGGQ